MKRTPVENGWTATTIGFAGYNRQAAALRAQGVHLNGPGASVSQDLEPEWITVSRDSRTAWGTLQENNAIAILDIPSASVKKIVGIGTKDHSLAANAFDASDRDSATGTGAINIKTWPVQGLYQPDSIEAVRIAGTDYLVIANEGPGRDVETARVSSLTLDPGKFPNGGDVKNCHARLSQWNSFRTGARGKNRKLQGTHGDIRKRTK